MAKVIPYNQDLPPWVEIEAEKKPRRKPGPKPSPRDMPKAKPQKVHVRIELCGSAEFTLEGEQAEDFKRLAKSLNLDEILDYLDPWASGIEVTQETRAAEEPKPGRSVWSCAISEQNGTVNNDDILNLYDPWHPRNIDWKRLA